MAKKSRKKDPGQRKRQAAGVLLFLLAALVLVSLVSHHHLDDRRISGEIDRYLNPFEIQYRNQAGMLGAYLACVLMVRWGWVAYFVPRGRLVV